MMANGRSRDRRMPAATQCALCVTGCDLSQSLEHEGKITLSDIVSFHHDGNVAPAARIARMKKDDIKATLVVRKAVFADDTVGEYSP